MASASRSNSSLYPAYVKNEFTEIDYDKSLQLVDYRRAAHCMIFARWNEMLFKKYNARAAVLMQLRFDGHIGFPGGLVDPGEEVTKAVNRELAEETNIDSKKHHVTAENHVVTHIDYDKKFITHFFTLEVTLEEFIVIERRSLESDDFGEEVLGTLRVTLFTMHDNYRGFPAFLNNNFIGNSKEQLCRSLRACNILTDEEIVTALAVSHERSQKNN